MAMLHIMEKIRDRWNPNLMLEVAHFNHKLRPEAAEEVTVTVSSVYNLFIMSHTHTHTHTHTYTHTHARTHTHALTLSTLFPSFHHCYRLGL